MKETNAQGGKEAMQSGARFDRASVSHREAQQARTAEVAADRQARKGPLTARKSRDYFVLAVGLEAGMMTNIHCYNLNGKDAGKERTCVKKSFDFWELEGAKVQSESRYLPHTEACIILKLASY